MKSMRDAIGASGRLSTSSRTRPGRSRPRAEGSASFATSSGDLGRLVQANSGLLTFAGLTLGVFVSRKFFVLPLAVAFTIAQEMAKDRLGADRRPRRR